jgi:ABC-type lipoprotein release transport system permease subunit
MTLSSIAELMRTSFRNLGRYKAKAFLSILAIAISVASYILTDSWLAGINAESRRNTVSYETGAAKLQTKAYFEKLADKPAYESFSDWKRYATALEKAGYDAAPRFVFAGSLFSWAGYAPVEINGIDPALDERVLRASNAIESGRHLKNGEFGMLLGTITADRLKVGIPARTAKPALENEILSALAESERSFVKGLYETEADESSGAASAKQAEMGEGGAYYVLRSDISAEELDAYWALLEGIGRMDVRISTVIEYKMAPDSVRNDKYESDLLPLLTDEELSLFSKAYVYDELLDAWMLNESDPEAIDAVLQAMLRMNYAGAIRRVNQMIEAKVVGIISAPNPKLNSSAFFPLDVLQGEAGLMLDGRVNELVIRKRNASDTALPKADESAARIKAAIEKVAGQLPEDMSVEGWEGYVKGYLTVSAILSWSFYIALGALFVLSFMGIATTMRLEILKRTKEIGMMRAQGVANGQLLFALMMEAGMAGLAGSAIGLAIGCLLNIHMASHGVGLSSLMDAIGGDSGYRINGAFRSAWNPAAIIAAAIAPTALSAILAFFPAWRALKMPAAESMELD